MNSKRGILAGVAGIAFVWGIWAICNPPFLLRVFTEYDNNVYGLVAREMLLGAKPYTDIFDHKLPGLYLLLAAVQGAFGSSTLVINLLYYLLSLAGLTSVYLIAKKLGARWWMAALVVSLLVVWTNPFFQNLQYFGSMTIAFYNVGLIIAALEAVAICLAMYSNRWWVWLFSGLLLALATMIKPQSLLLFIVLAVWRYRSGKRLSEEVSRFGTEDLAGADAGDLELADKKGTRGFVVQGILPLFIAYAGAGIAVLSWLAFSGLMPGFMTAMKYNQSYIAGTPVSQSLGWLVSVFSHGPDLLILGAAAVVAVYLAFWNPTGNWFRHTRTGLVIWWMVVGIISCAMGRRDFAHNMLVFYFPAAALAAYGLSEAHRWLKEQAWQAPRLVTSGFVLLILAAGYARTDERTFRTLTLWKPSLKSSPVLSEWPIGAFSPGKLMASQWLRYHSQPDEAALIMGPEAAPIYWASDRRPATRFVFMGPLTGNLGGTTGEQSETLSASFNRSFLRDIQKNEPVFVGDTLRAVVNYRGTKDEKLRDVLPLHFVTRAFGIDWWMNSNARVAEPNPWKRKTEGGVTFPDTFDARNVTVASSAGKMWAVTIRQGESLAVERTVSTDGLVWQNRAAGLIERRDIEPGTIGKPALLVKGGVWTLYYPAVTYSTASDPSLESGGHYAVFAALSRDQGATWTSIRTPAMVSPKQGKITSVAVVYDQARALYRMWYTSNGDVFCAQSSDSLTWTQSPGDGQNGAVLAADRAMPWEAGGIINISLVQYQGWHHLVYESAFTPEGPSVICYARSKDGITNWDKYDYNPVISPEADSWYEAFTASPSIVRLGGSWAIYYTGQRYGSPRYGAGFYSCPVNRLNGQL